MTQSIFVFGSNLSGIHGAGSARYAYDHHHAVWGVGHGLTGQAYALPTKGWEIAFMPLWQVAAHVHTFIEFAKANPEMTFQVTRVGCGLAGFKDSQIAPLFKDAPKNCQFDTAWQPYLGDAFTYWGTV